MVARMALGLAALALSVVAPVHAAASIESVGSLNEALISSAMVLYLNGPGVDLNAGAGANALIPLTYPAGLNQTASKRENISFQGRMVPVDTNNFNSIKGNGSIAYLSCDSNANYSSITPSSMFQTLMENSPAAIILYSLQGNGCEVKSDGLSYWAIYTMSDPQASQGALNVTEAARGNVEATISGTGNATSDVSQGPQPGDQNGSNSAVAMSILYSITGIITLLFLVIIATGAVRAHRYPDRYGPRAGYAGRSRQSRAKGLARAVLETLPIVKFGDTTHPPKGDPEQELQSIPEERAGTAAQLQATTTPSAKPPQHGATTPNEDGTRARASSEASNPAAAPASLNTEGDDSLGCSICTEDFTVGEDVRVLPCNHKYHPQCIDPWLVDVSGTCPLCRLDLRPADAEGETASPLPAGFAPPLENDGNESEGASQRSTQRNRMSRFFDINRLRHASAEERIEALRRYRTEHGDVQDPSPPSGPSGETPANEETSRRARLTDRLRDKFRIRTTRRGGDGPLERESSGAGT